MNTLLSSIFSTYISNNKQTNWSTKISTFICSNAVNFLIIRSFMIVLPQINIYRRIICSMTGRLTLRCQRRVNWEMTLELLLSTLMILIVILFMMIVLLLACFDLTVKNINLHISHIYCNYKAKSIQGYSTKCAWI